MSGAGPPLLTVSNNGIGVVPDALLNSFVQGGAVVADLRNFIGLYKMQVWVVGTTTPNDGGQGMFFYNPTATTADDDGVTSIAPHGVTLGRWLRQSGDVFHLLNVVADYGADPTGVNDSTLAFQNAASSGFGVFVPTGTYKVSNTIPLTSGSYLIGVGVGTSIIIMTSTSRAVFTLANGVNNAGLSGMTITRSVTPISGAFGISTARSGALDDVENINFFNLSLDSHWNGLFLGPTNYSLLQNIVVQKCYDTGIAFSNTIGTSLVGSNPLQWTLDHVLSQNNVQHGFTILGVNQTHGPGTPMSLGEWRNISTFANSGGGVYVLGNTSCAISGFRLGSNSFIGGDGNTELYLDTYGVNHEINCYIELAGQTNTGLTNSTPPSNQGYGVFISNNNSGVVLRVTIDACSFDGLYSVANLYDEFTAPTILINPMITNNGLAGVSGAQSGVTLAANSGGGMVISGGFIGQWNTNPAATEPRYQQHYGVNIATDFISIVGCRLVGANNKIGPFFAAVSLTSNSYLDVLAGGGGGGVGVSSVVGASGNVTLAELITGGVAPLDSPAFTTDATLNGDHLGLSPASDFGQPGYIAFPVHGTAFNLQFQWGTTTLASGTSVAVTFPNTFANGILMDPVVTPAASAGVQVSAAAGNVTLSGFTIHAVNSSSGGSLTSQPFNWFVIGY